VRVVWPTPITANQLTGLSLVTGTAAALCFVSTDRTAVWTGIGLMLLYGVLDCADGQLARARGTSSRLGRILDGSSDYVVGLLSTATLGWHQWQLEGGLGLGAVLLGMSAFGVQAVAFDKFKNRWLALAKGDFQEGEDLEETEAELAGATGLNWFALRVYALFLRAQGTARPPTGDPQRLLPLARASAWLGPSTHIALLCLAAGFGALTPYFLARALLGTAALAGIALAWRARE